MQSCQSLDIKVCQYYTLLIRLFVKFVINAISLLFKQETGACLQGLLGGSKIVITILKEIFLHCTLTLEWEKIRPGLF